MGNDTFKYHKEHGAVLYKNAEPEELEELERKGWRDNPADADKVGESLENSTEEGNEEPEETEPEEAPTEIEELADEISFACGVADCEFIGKSDQSVEQHRRMKHKV
jgi:hypothetical protein